MMIFSRNKLLAGLPIVALLCATMPVEAAINAGDKLDVHVYNHPELSMLATVDSQGAIQLPVIGTVRAQGLDSKAVAYVIRERIKPYVPYPAVDVRDTSESQMLFVSGAPGGVLPYSPNETLSAAVAEITKAAQFAATPQTPPNAQIDRLDSSRLDLRRVAVYRDGHSVGTFDMIALRGSGEPGPTLHANDTVSFANKPVAVNVVGAVYTPGVAYLWPNEPLSDALIQSGGVVPGAASNSIQVSHSGSAAQTVAFGNSVFNEPAKIGDTISVPIAPRVTVAGLVEKPGPVVLQNDFTLISAIAAAGGYNKFGNLRNVQVIHDGAITHYNIVNLAHGDLTQNPSLHDGDTVYVPEGTKTDWSMVWQALSGLGGLGNFGYFIKRY